MEHLGCFVSVDANQMRRSCPSHRISNQQLGLEAK
jgi:hypothetical protein